MTCCGCSTTSWIWPRWNRAPSRLEVSELLVGRAPRRPGMGVPPRGRSGQGVAFHGRAGSGTSPATDRHRPGTSSPGVEEPVGQRVQVHRARNRDSSADRSGPNRGWRSPMRAELDDADTASSPSAVQRHRHRRRTRAPGSSSSTRSPRRTGHHRPPATAAPAWVCPSAASSSRLLGGELTLSERARGRAARSPCSSPPTPPGETGVDSPRGPTPHRLDGTAVRCPSSAALTRTCPCLTRPASRRAASSPARRCWSSTMTFRNIFAHHRAPGARRASRCCRPKAASDAIALLRATPGCRSRADGHHDAGHGRLLGHPGRSAPCPGDSPSAIIALTAKTGAGERERCLAAGATGHTSPSRSKNGADFLQAAMSDCLARARGRWPLRCSV